MQCCCVYDRKRVTLLHFTMVKLYIWMFLLIVCKCVCVCLLPVQLDLKRDHVVDVLQHVSHCGIRCICHI